MKSRATEERNKYYILRLTEIFISWAIWSDNAANSYSATLYIALAEKNQLLDSGWTLKICISLRLTWFRTGCCGLSWFVQCLNIDLQFAPKYVRILVCRLHLFWGAGSFPRAKLEETRTSRNRWCPRTNIRAYLRAKWRLNGVYHPSYVSAARKTECDKWLTVKTFTANDLFLQFPCFWTKRRSLLYWASSLTILPYHQLKF